MRFEIIKTKQAQEKIQERLRNTYRVSLSPSRGKLVSYTIPALKDPFPQLRKAILKTRYWERFHHIGYYIETKNGYIRQYFLAGQYYVFNFKYIADKLYSLTLNIERIQKIIKDIQVYYQKTRKILPRTGQPSFNIGDQVYALKSEIAGLLFNVRSIMDSIATMLHFLYGPSSRQFCSFSDYIKYICKDKHRSGEISDDTMKQYIKNHMEWFFIVRDIRDYVTHVGSIDISFYERGDHYLVTIIQDRFEVEKLLNSIILGLRDFLNFFDNYFANRIINEKT
ncbi:hypothetical protein [Thermosulfurimonas dismutans]|uniref:Cthe-2314-like HEPN domain-containing protein n=1 Tax=Thermosulfurimonas dismutans TaxID=999894 RepID=A0A179D331_9BACT|nr:hypothetical protein [Thermosulfurimonas dismutans]OAQ20038.1 hypothetical protein TDIS_1857 [Thermosulfurimonas dismutans]